MFLRFCQLSLIFIWSLSYLLDLQLCSSVWRVTYRQVNNIDWLKSNTASIFIAGSLDGSRGMCRSVISLSNIHARGSCFSCYDLRGSLELSLGRLTKHLIDVSTFWSNGSGPYPSVRHWYKKGSVSGQAVFCFSHQAPRGIAACSRALSQLKRQPRRLQSLELSLAIKL